GIVNERELSTRFEHQKLTDTRLIIIPGLT
ncbi:unnamed protein product, partial [marine sediment metagenome]